MKVLSLYPEHAKAFELGLRRYETRSWSTTYRGPVALYSSRRVPWSAEACEDPYARAVMLDLLRERDADGVQRVDLVRGRITVVVDLVDCVPMLDPRSPKAEATVPHVAVHRNGWLFHWKGDNGKGWVVADDITDERPFGMFKPGNHALVLANPRPLAESVSLPRNQIPQGRPWNLRGEALDQVLAQLAVPA